MAAASYDIFCEQGATLSLALTYRDSDGDLVNLTGYTARLQVRESVNAASTLVSLTSSSGITLGGSAGTIQITLSATTTAGLPKGTYVYDLELVSGGTVTRLLKGKFTVDPEVTR